MNFESLNSNKFKSLSKSQKLNIRGGAERTEGRSYQTGVVESYVRDGVRYGRPQIHSYSSDLNDGKTLCYVDEEFCWGEEFVYID